MDELEALRQRIDETDRRLLETLAERMKRVAEVGRLKAQGALFLRDHEREAKLLSRVEALARELGLDPFRATEIFREVIAMSVKVQEEVLVDRRVAERSPSATAFSRGCRMPPACRSSTPPRLPAT